MMHIGPWYDPIARRWQKPKPPQAPEIVTFHEDEYTKARRRARERIIWDAVVSTSQASQQLDGAE